MSMVYSGLMYKGTNANGTLDELMYTGANANGTPAEVTDVFKWLSILQLPVTHRGFVWDGTGLQL